MASPPPPFPPYKNAYTYAMSMHVHLGVLHASSSHQLQLDIEKGGWDQETAHADTIYLEIILGMPEDKCWYETLDAYQH